MSWKTSFYDSRVEAGLFKMPAGFVARFIRYAERMEVYGPDLGMPHTRAMGGGLFELRLKGPEGIGRVFYCILSGQRIMTLHHFAKKTQKIPSKELDIARKRLKEVKDE